LLLLISIAPAGFGKARRYMGRREYSRYTRNLPYIDRVELLHLKTKDDQWNGEILATKVLRGTAAQRVASLWRSQTYNLRVSACHNPDYAIKFYVRGKLLMYASVCWGCNNIFMITPNLATTQNFLGGDRRGERLLEVFDSAFRAAR
jgi:hypothetical protein